MLCVYSRREQCSPLSWIQTFGVYFSIGEHFSAPVSTLSASAARSDLLLTSDDLLVALVQDHKLDLGWAPLVDLAMITALFPS